MAVTVNDGSLQWVAGIDTSQLKKQIDEVNGLLSGIQQKAEQETSRIDALARKAAAGFTAYLSVNAATDFIRNMVHVRGEFQKLEVSFTTFLKSKEKADILLAEATKLAAKTPFTLQDVGEGAKKLLAYGFSADVVIDTLTRLGDISAGVGAPIGDLAYLFGTLKAQGRAFTIDIRQFANRGIPIYEELAKVLGVSVKEVNSLVEAGKVGFPEVEQAFKNMTSEGGLFFNLMESQSKTLTGQLSNLQDAVSQMFNELGKDNEGVFSDIISGLTTVVHNFETVIDIVKILVIAYGSYRAAIILTNTIQAVATSITKGYTVAELLRYNATLLTEKATRLLNATLLKNPAAFVIAGIATIVASLAIFGKATSKAKSAQELLGASQEKFADQMAETESKIRPYVDSLKNATVTEEQSLEIYKKLNAINPAIVQGLDAKKLSYENLTVNVNKYLDSLRNQFKLEANRDAVLESIKLEQVFQKQADISAKKRDKANKEAEALKKKGDREGAGLAQFTAIEAETARKIAEKNRDDQKKISEELGKTQIADETKKQEVKLRTLEIIDEEIKAEKEKQSKFSDTSAKYKEFQKAINKLEEERKAITGETKKGNKEENDRNSILEKRVALLQQIADLERNAAQTGLIEKTKAVDQINEKYDKQLLAIKQANEEIEKFNKKNRQSPVALIGQKETDRVNTARRLELANAQYKEDAANFLTSVKDKQKAFEQYQKALETGNAEIVRQAAATLTKDLGGFENYIDFLKAQIATLNIKKVTGKGNFADDLAIEELNKVLLEAQKQADEKNRQLQLDNFQKMLGDLQSFNEKRTEINRKYDELEATLRKNEGVLAPDVLEARGLAIKKGREEEITALNNDIIRQSDLYKQLNQDIIGFTRQRIREQIKMLKAQLKSDTSLSPQIKADIQNAIDQYEGLLNSTNVVVQDFEKLGSQLGDISGIFGTLASAVEGLNDGLADTLNTLGEIAGVGAQAANAIAQFASGNIIGGVASAISAIAGLFTIGKKARESRRKAEAEIAAFQQKVLQGEIDVNILFRQRQVEQAKLNKLKLEGIKAETDALKTSRDQNLKDYNRVLQQLQNESFVSGQRTKKFGGVLGIGRKTKVVDELSSLAGLNFEQLEKLFLEGRLTEKAKELFQTLQKLKEEGLDIDRALEEARERAKELFTGTTAESIANSIVEGFKAGKRSAADFADDFQGLMQEALLQALEMKALEGPLIDFFDKFAADAESNGGLDSGEMERLQALYNSIINNAATQFEQLQDIAGINFSPSQASGNALQGAIRGITESQAELLAGQFGGLRLTALDQLNIARQSMDIQQNIEINTSYTKIVSDILRRLEINGIKVI